MVVSGIDLVLLIFLFWIRRPFFLLALSVTYFDPFRKILATVQVVTFRLRVMVLIEEGYGKMKVNGPVRQKDWKQRTRKGRQTKGEIDRKEEPELSY